MYGRGVKCRLAQLILRALSIRTQGSGRICALLSIRALKHRDPRLRLRTQIVHVDNVRYEYNTGTHLCSVVSPLAESRIWIDHAATRLYAPLRATRRFTPPRSCQPHSLSTHLNRVHSAAASYFSSVESIAQIGAARSARAPPGGRCNSRSPHCLALIHFREMKSYVV